MKNNYLIFAAIIVSLLSSCTIEKRLYMPGYHVDIKNGGNNSKRMLVDKPGQKNTSESSNIEHANIISETDDSVEAKQDLMATTSNDVSEIVAAKSVPAATKRAGNVKFPATHHFDKISFLKKKKNDPPYYAPSMVYADSRTHHWAGLVGFLTGVVGIFFAGIIMGIFAITFSAVALSAIKKQPEKYSGKGMAIAGLIIGIVVLVLTMVLISVLV